MVLSSKPPWTSLVRMGSFRDICAMFTGIVETVGIIKRVSADGGNQTFIIESTISNELRPDQSVSHSGVCLTVEEVIGDTHRVTAIEETLKKTNLGYWQKGELVNLERSLKMYSRLDGHLVQGHVDAIAKCVKRVEKEGSWEFEFTFPKKFGNLIIEKGSVCVNGISLTAFDVKRKSFTVAIIPYTLEHTNVKSVHEGQFVNIEFDMIGKYVLRGLSLKE
jgi:riboflavin synthase